jgi:putative RNA 2'-phosphotransferase
MDARSVKISKFLSSVVRHKPETIGLKLDKAGWASVRELITACGERGVAFSLEELQQVVTNQ